MAIYEGKVTWVGDNRDGSTRFRVATAPEGEFFTADDEFRGKPRKFAVVKVEVQQRGKQQYVTRFKEVSPPDDNPRGGSRGGYGGGNGGGQRSGGGGYNRGGSSGPSARDKYFEDKDKYDKETREPRIQQQAARRDAIDFLTLLVANGAVNLGSGKADKKAEILENELNRITTKFWKETQTLEKLKQFTEEEQEDPSVDEPPADDFGDDPGSDSFDDDGGDDF